MNTQVVPKNNITKEITVPKHDAFLCEHKKCCLCRNYAYVSYRDYKKYEILF